MHFSTLLIGRVDLKFLVQNIQYAILHLKLIVLFQVEFALLVEVVLIYFTFVARWKDDW